MAPNLPRTVPYVQVPPCSWKPTSSSGSAPKKLPVLVPFVQVPPSPWNSLRKRKRSPSQSSSPPRRRFRDSRSSEEETVVGDLGDLSIPKDDYFEMNSRVQHVAEEHLPDVLDESVGVGEPIRRLTNFCIFFNDTLQLVDSRELLALLGSEDEIHPSKYSVSGIVSNSNNENAVAVGILCVTGFNVHHLEDAQFDGHIYVRTWQAWYILESPSQVYQSYWESLSLSHQFGHLVLETSFRNKRLKYEDFVQDLPRFVQTCFAKSPDLLKIRKQLTHDAFQSDDVTAYLMQIIDLVVSRGSNSMRHVPLLKIFMDSALLYATTVAQSFVTPSVKSVISRFISSRISSVGPEREETPERLQLPCRRARHLRNPTEVRWGDSLGRHGFYSSVTMDGATYSIGQVVAVMPDNRKKSDLEASRHCNNILANQYWFIQIKYFFQEGQDKKFHGQWFSHGSRTWFQQVCHSQELFLLNQCDDVHVASIYQRTEVDFLGPQAVAKPDERDPECQRFFCQLACNEDLSLTSLPTPELSSRLLEHLNAYKPCENCGREAEESLSAVEFVNDGISQYGQVYHIGDFVYVKPNATANHLLFIARIRSINGEHLSVRYYHRDADDTRRLYCTARKNDVQVGDLDGLCWVRYLDPQYHQQEIKAWAEHPDHFYTHQVIRNGELVDISQEEFNYCIPCLEKHQQELEVPERYARQRGPIQVLELFAGAGGLSQGLGHSPLLSTKWAAELSVAAAKTFQLNHPETNVLNVDVNDLLRYYAGPQDGKHPLRSANDTQTAIPDDQIPKPGQVDILCGGPPCQSFSGANSHPKKGDPRSVLPFTMLSLVEVLQPKLFLLENVTGLLWHSDSKDEERVTFKLIIRVLITLGYQARFAVLQAGQYGAPQDRQRVIIFGAKRGLELPEFPKPTHAFHKQARVYTLVDDNFTTPVRRGRGSNDNYLSAPHSAVSIRDAISDLPAFDWKNPHQIVPETPHDIARRRARVARGIQQFDVNSKEGVGFVEAVEYFSLPVTPYQRAMRGNNSKTVNYHFTPSESQKVAEICAWIPLKARASHRDLSDALLDAGSLDRERKEIKYGRLGMEGHFMTALTAMKPSSRGSHVLHPEQHRAYSVAEARRAQGFPDDYILWSDKPTPGLRIADYYRHIGNAVPVPLAAALGRSLEAVFVRELLNEPSRPPSPEL